MTVGRAHDTHMRSLEERLTPRGSNKLKFSFRLSNNKSFKRFVGHKTITLFSIVIEYFFRNSIDFLDAQIPIKELGSLGLELDFTAGQRRFGRTL
jgi:hypothetical protein